MPRTLLLLLLALALLLELALAGGAFFAPEFLLTQFKVTFVPEMDFLVYVLGWLLAFVCLLIVLAIAWVAQGKAGYAALCYLLGWWWVAIGAGIYIAFGRPDNLLLDSLKGLLLILLTWQCQQRRLVVRR